MSQESIKCPKCSAKLSLSVALSDDSETPNQKNPLRSRCPDCIGITALCLVFIILVLAGVGALDRFVMLNKNIIWGFVVAVFVGWPFVWLIVDKWLRKDHPRKSKFAYTWVVGIIERASYMVAFLMGRPEWVTVWLTFKVAIVWAHRPTAQEDKDSYNIFIIGNGLSILFGFLGAWVAWGFTIPEPLTALCKH